MKKRIYILTALSILVFLYGLNQIILANAENKIVITSNESELLSNSAVLEGIKTVETKMDCIQNGISIYIDDYDNNQSFEIDDKSMIDYQIIQDGIPFTTKGLFQNDLRPSCNGNIVVIDTHSYQELSKLTHGTRVFAKYQKKAYMYEITESKIITDTIESNQNTDEEFLNILSLEENGARWLIRARRLA